MKDFDVNVIAGSAPPRHVVLMGGPFDGTAMMAAGTQWLGVADPDTPERVEWYYKMAVRRDRAVVYTHTSVVDREVDWPTVLGYDPVFGPPPDDGEDPQPVPS